VDLAVIAQSSTLIMIALDLDGKFIALNPAAERFYALTAAELLGQPLTMILDSFSHEKSRLMLERTFQDGGVEDWELDHIRSDHALILVSYTTSVLYDEKNTVRGCVAVGRDLTCNVELSDQLAVTNQKLEGTLLQLERTHAELKAVQTQLVQSEKMRALGQMVAGVAHEINNPAAFVTSNLEYLARLVPALHQMYMAYAALKPSADEQQRSAIQAAEKAADIEHLWQDLPDVVTESLQGIRTITDIVLSLRNFARLDEAELKEVNVNDGLRSSLNIVRALNKDRIAFSTDFGDVPQLLCRPGQLNQVFLNLLTNAADAIENTGAIWVQSRCVDSEVVITVQDTGKGMAADIITRLGEPFFTTKPIGSGMGLGLAISYGIIAGLQGRLRFESKVGMGTSAIVALPINFLETGGLEPK